MGVVAARMGQYRMLTMTAKDSGRASPLPCDAVAKVPSPGAPVMLWVCAPAEEFVTEMPVPLETMVVN
jgi:hypothetical protein